MCDHEDVPRDWLRVERIKSRPTLYSLAAIAVAVLVVVLTLPHIDENAIGSYGLITVLPPHYYVCVAVVLGVLIANLRRKVAPTAVMAVGSVALVLVVHGAATLIESEARFPVVWLHAGFADSLMTLGHPTPSFDARMSWPGFFSAGAALSEMVGVQPTFWLKWAPVFMIWCYIPLLVMIGRAVHNNWRAPWVGVMIFVIADWVGQDYFAPQTTAYIMYLAVIAVLLTYLRVTNPGWFSDRWQNFASDRGKLTGWFGSMIQAGGRDREEPELPATRAVRIGLVIVLCLISFAMVSAHQLTPVVLAVLLFALAIVGRSRPWPLFLFVGVCVLGWLSYGAEVFWQGHLNDIFGGLGRIGSVFNSGVTQRVTGSSQHLLVLKFRMLLPLLIWGLAGLGAIRMWWSGKRVSVVALLMTGVPGFLIGAQSYGGEGLLRVFLMSLPGAVLLVAGLFFPTPAIPRWKTFVAFSAACLLIFPMFLIARWGNEDFERIDTSDVALRAAIYQVAPLGATIGTLADGGPGSFEHLTQYQYVPTLAGDWPVTNVDQVNKILGNNPKGVYLMISRPQVANLVQNASAPSDAGQTLAQMLVDSGQYKIVYQNDSGVILQRIGAGDGPVDPEPSSVTSSMASLESQP